MKKTFLSILFPLLFLLVAFTLFSGDKEQVKQQSEVFSSFLNNLDQYYVDSTDAHKILKTAVNAALKSLDPYSYFISEEDQEQSRKSWKGILYGGLGVYMVERDSQCVISDIVANFPGAKNDLRHGDVLLEGNGIPFKGMNMDSIVKIMRGDPGTTLTLKILRNKTIVLEKKLIREQIMNHSVTCASMLPNGIGYIRFMHFLDGSSEELKQVIMQLKKENRMSSLIIDIRDNTGGLVVEAVNTANLFLPKGKNIVSFKGRAKEWNYENPTLYEPLDTLLPLVLITDKYSISAAELLAGAIQDYDRGVVVGQKTFGKGFVQGTRGLPFNNSMYMTSARYHTPSGRCIQELDYTHLDKNGKAQHIPDSLRKEFHTSAGRKVFDIGGIAPDVKTKEAETSTFIPGFIKSNLIFDFANDYRNHHASINDAAQFEVSESEYTDFVSFVKSKNYPFTTSDEEQLDSFAVKAKQENHYKALAVSYAVLKKDLRQQKALDLQTHRIEIKNELEKEIAARYYFQPGRISSMIKHDNDVKEAVSILNDQERYRSILKK